MKVTIRTNGDVLSANILRKSWLGCLNSFGRFAKWISATDYAAAIIGVSALK